MTYWFGLIDGLLKMSNDDRNGPLITFTGIAPGGWFGEGTAIKRETYRYNVLALRRSGSPDCRWRPSAGCSTTRSASTASS